MKKYYVLILLALFAIPLTAIGQETFQVKKSPFSFNLAERDEKCIVSYQKKGVIKEVILNLASPCKIVRIGANGKVIEHYYKDIRATVVMFGGGLKKGNCAGDTADATQTIIIGRNFVKAGAKREGTCLPDGPDEKEFWLSSH